MQLHKALYGCLCRALLFYHKLKGEFEAFGFLLNHYDACVYNKWVNAIQPVVTWHVDNLKISHKESSDVTKMITYLEAIYDPMTVKQGNKHTYMGMDMDFTEKGTVKVSITGYIFKDFDELLEGVTTPVVSPAAEHQFNIHTIGNRLSEERAVLLHRLVSKLLFVRKNVRPDIQPTISFLMTRVKDPDEDDCKNL